MPFWASVSGISATANDGWPLNWMTVTLDDDAIGNLCCQFLITADYDGIGAKGSKFAFYL
jgi:hypothetical protein